MYKTSLFPLKKGKKLKRYPSENQEDPISIITLEPV